MNEQLLGGESQPWERPRGPGGKFLKLAGDPVAPKNLGKKKPHRAKRGVRRASLKESPAPEQPAEKRRPGRPPKAASNS